MIKCSNCGNILSCSCQVIRYKDVRYCTKCVPKEYFTEKLNKKNEQKKTVIQTVKKIININRRNVTA